MFELLVGWHACDKLWRRCPLHHGQQMLPDFKILTETVLAEGWVPLVFLQHTFHRLHQSIKYLVNIQVSVRACEHNLM